MLHMLLIQMYLNLWTIKYTVYNIFNFSVVYIFYSVFTLAHIKAKNSIDTSDLSLWSHIYKTVFFSLYGYPSNVNVCYNFKQIYVFSSLFSADYGTTTCISYAYTLTVEVEKNKKSVCVKAGCSAALHSRRVKIINI